MEETKKRSLSSSVADDVGVTQGPPKRVKKSPRYLLARTTHDQEIIANVFIPTTPNGHKVVETLKKLDGSSLSEAIDEFANAFPPLDEDDTAQDLAKRHENIKRMFPFLGKTTSLEDVAMQTGTLEDWREDEYVSVIPIFAGYDY